MMKPRKRWLAMFLAVMLLGTLLPSAAWAAGDGAQATGVQFEDMPDDWSRAPLERAVENGLLTGTDGKLMPQGKLTRAQMAAVITRAFGATVEGDLSAFSDVSDAWYTPYVAKAYQMGVLNGADGKMNPKANITRQEVFTILARALKLEGASSIAGQFHDLDQIAPWAKGAIYAMVNAGYVEGSNGYLNPRGEMTRAEFAKLMDNAIEQYISQAGTVTAVAAGNIMVNHPGVTLQGATIQGDLIVGDGVGDGEVILDSVTITGRLVVRGGGEHSVIIRGSSSVSNVIVARVDGAVRVKVEDGAQVEVVYIDDGSDDVRIEGAVGELTIAASDIQVTTAGANIQTVAVSGENTTVVVDETSSLGTISVQASNTQVEVAGTVANIVTSAPNTKVKGTGTVELVEAQPGATGASIETPNTSITVGAGVSGVTAAGGEPVSSGATVVNNNSGTGVTTPTSSGGDGGGGSYTPPSIGLSQVTAVNATTVSFRSDTAGATVKWNGELLQIGLSDLLTVSGVNQITVPFMISGYSNQLTLEKSGYYAASQPVVYTGPYNTNAGLGEWVADRTEPQSWTISDGRISLITETEPQNNWYAWQGRKSATGVGLTSDWMVETQLELTEEMIARDGIRASVWLQVEGSHKFGDVHQNGVIDWAILQFKKENATDTAGWQSWDSQVGGWTTLGSVPIEPGTYTLTMIYSQGTIYQYINGKMVRQYSINTAEGISAPTQVIIQSYSFGESYGATWKVPTVAYHAQYPADARIVSTGDELKAAVEDAAVGETIYLGSGTFELTEILNVERSVSLIGLGDVTIQATGSWPDNSHPNFNSVKHLICVHGGTQEQPVTLSNLTLDSNELAYGLNTYAGAYLVLDDVTLQKSLGAGLTVNGSVVEANNLNTTRNSWGGVNVDPGSGVDSASVFTLTGEGSELDETRQIWSDGRNVSETATVTVNAAGHTKYKEAGQENAYVWSNRPPAVSINREEGTTVYSTIQAAVNGAQAGDVIVVGAGSFTENLTISQENITLTSATGKEHTTIVGTITITADNVTVQNLKILAPATYSGPPVIHMIDAEDVRIIGNIVQTAGSQAYAAIGTSAGPAKITGTISGNETDAMIIVGTDGTLTVSSNTVVLRDPSLSEGICFYPVGASAVLVATGNTITPKSENHVQILVVSKPASINEETEEAEMLSALSAGNGNAEVGLDWLTGKIDTTSRNPARLARVNTGTVIGYSVVVPLVEGTYQGAQVEISLYDAGGNLLQKNILAKDEGLSTSVSTSFDVSGNFDYEADGYWTLEGSIHDNATEPAKAVTKIVFANGKVVYHTITEFWQLP